MRETVLVTGASSGIGLELAKLFAAGGSDVVLAARTVVALQGLAETLEREHGIRARVAPCDLTDPAAPRILFDELEREGVAVDVLVNDAGMASVGPFVTHEIDGELDQLQVNVVALTHLTGLFLPKMAARRRGGVLNVASTAAFQPGPLMAVYYASKAYVLSFTVALADEMRGTGVTITCLCPGPTRTGFEERSGNAKTRLFRLPSVMDAVTVARAGYEGFREGRPVVIPGFLNKLTATASRLAPAGLPTKVARLLNEE